MAIRALADWSFDRLQQLEQQQRKDVQDQLLRKKAHLEKEEHVGAHAS